MATPAGRLAFRAFVALCGAIVVAVGLLLVPLPGPGWLIVFAGIAVWGIEFHWARRLLVIARRRLRWWTTLMRTGPWALRFTVGLASVAIVTAALVISLRYAAHAGLLDWIVT